MAHFGPNSELEVLRALDDHHVVFLVGPRRCGLSYWTERRLRRHQARGDGGDHSTHIDLDSARDAGQLGRALQSRLGISKSLKRPGDLQLALSRVQADVPHLVVLNNMHVAEPDCVDWLLRSLLDVPGGTAGWRVRFLLEGAISPDAALGRVFPNGLSTSFLIRFCEAETPWRRMVEAEEIIEARGRRVSPVGVAWITDLTGGDVRTAIEVLERLPSDGKLTQDVLNTARRRVVDLGKSANELRAAARPLAGTQLLRKVARGQVLRGPQPEVLQDQALQYAYFSGIIDYDPLLTGYRVRSPIVAEVIAGVCTDAPGRVFGMSDAILTRTTYLLAQIANVELQLRSALSDCDIVGLAQVAKTVGEYTGLAKRVRTEAAKTLDSGSMASLSGVLKTLLPDQVTVLDAVRARGAPVEPSSQDVLERVTLTELVSLARIADVIGPEQEARMKRVIRGRNAVAHLRGVDYDTALALARDVEDGLDELNRAVLATPAPA